jgi:hypothetical protein
MGAGSFHFCPHALSSSVQIRALPRPGSIFAFSKSNCVEFPKREIFLPTYAIVHCGPMWRAECPAGQAGGISPLEEGRAVAHPAEDHIVGWPADGTLLVCAPGRQGWRHPHPDAEEVRPRWLTFSTA